MEQEPITGGRLAREFDRAQSVYRRYGGGTAVRKAMKYPLEHLVARLDYLRYRRRYPVNLIFVASLAKSGSTWFADLLAGLPGFHKYQPAEWTASLIERPHHDFYPAIAAETKHRLAVVKGHTFGSTINADALKKSGIPYFITVRDPRDQIISGYWYLRNRPLHPVHQLAMDLSLPDFVTLELDPETAAIPRLSWLRSWIANRDPSNSLVVRYEDLLNDTAGELQSCFDFLGIEVEASFVDLIVQKNSFEAKAGRSPGTEDKGSFRRKGVAGEWRDVFTDSQKEKCAIFFEDVISALGYEPTLAGHSA
jgi:hypothetical protein